MSVANQHVFSHGMQDTRETLEVWTGHPWSVLRGWLALSVAIAISLLVGMAGYHWLVALSWVDAYENAAMILSGMGPVATPETWGGKVFAGTYALYSGIALLATTAVVFAPVVHRFLHYLHADPKQKL